MKTNPGSAQTAEVLMSTEPEELPAAPAVISEDLSSSTSEPSTALPESPSSSTPHHVAIQCREDFGLTKTPVSLATHDSKFWPYVFKRFVVDKESNKVLFNDSADPKKPRKLLLRDIPPDASHVVARFHLRLPVDLECPTERSAWNLSSHQVRQLTSQIKAAAAVEPANQDPPLVVEVFSPPRFAPTARARNFAAKSVDIKPGTDLSCPKNRSQLKAELRRSLPDLLVLCPPCTNESGWIHLNATRN